MDDYRFLEIKDKKKAEFMAINKLNYHFENKGNIQQGDKALNKDTFQTLTDKVDEIVDFLNSEIAEEKIIDANNGYIKFENGIFIQWKTVSGDVNIQNKMGDLTVDYTTFVDGGKWDIQFTKFFFSISRELTNQGWFASHSNGSAIYYGGGYYYSTRTTAHNIAILNIGFGTWK